MEQFPETLARILICAFLLLPFIMLIWERLFKKASESEKSEYDYCGPLTVEPFTDAELEIIMKSRDEVSSLA